MIKLTGEVKNVNTAITRLQSLNQAIREELSVTVDLLGTDLLERAKSYVTQKLNKRPKGNLLGALNKKTEETSTAITSTVGVSLGTIPYARIHEFGGVIEAKNSPYLVFQTADGEWHKVKSVKMPERSYLRAALADMTPTVEKQIRKALARAAERSGFGS